MGSRGPRKKLALLKMLEGNPSKEVIVESGIAGLGEPFIAEHLMDDARGCIEVIKQSMPPRIYSALDSFLLAAFGTAWAIHKRAALEIGNPRFAFVVSTAKGDQRQSPWLIVLTQQAKLMASLGDRLGLDPKSRAALRLPNARQQAEPIESFIGQRRTYSMSRNN